ncbi:MAG: haloacid dehalogenase-like hydrolase [Clostridia bacterium]|nr:haloacid dehalogenase-like hydrolase [Clostridia bacterium]
MKHIIFDFDGTLTKSKGNIWKNLYKTLGYSVDSGSKYKKDLHLFLDGKLTYNDWCKINAKDYRVRNLTIDTIDSLSDEIELFSDMLDTIKSLHKRGYHLHIVSGNVGYVIARVLGKNARFFESIRANEFVFKGDRFYDIIPTKYDCEGKALFVQEVIASGVDKSNIYFVGNGINDEWVASTGVRTICINPEDTDSSNADIWHENIDSLSQLLTIIE